jgi:hypothetical protein
MINEKNWKNKNHNRNQTNVDEKKRFENFNENLDDDLKNDLEDTNFMNTKFLNLHIILSFSI